MLKALVACLLLLAFGPTQDDSVTSTTQEAATKPTSASAPAPVRRALIVSIDGLRPDVLLRANMPNVRRLMSRGSFSMWAQTTAVAITLPSHVSMLTGVRPRRHGIEWNDDLPLSKPIYPKVPTIFELGRKAGKSTAMVTTKLKFNILNKPDTIDWCWTPATDAVGDELGVEHAIEILNAHQPDLMFVHFSEVDIVGHGKGWGTEEQLAAAGHADEHLGNVLEAYRAKGLLDSTLVIVSADHGGTAGSHGADDVNSRTIPWIIAGPGIRQNFDLTRVGDLQIRTEDTFATACDWLGIDLPKKIDGKPVKAAFLPAGKK